MSAISTALRQGLSVLGTALGSPVFLWNGSLVACVPSTVREENKPQFGGFDDLGAVRLTVRLADWWTADSTLITADSTLYTADSDGRKPVVGRTVQYLGVTYRITAITMHHGNSAYTLRLEAPNR